MWSAFHPFSSAGGKLIAWGCVRNDLADVYESAGRLPEAVELCERTLAGRVRVLGRDHPSTLMSRDNLASAYREAGRDADADHLEGDD